MSEPQAKPAYLDGQALVDRLLAWENPMGATYRLCCLTQPSSFTELHTYCLARAGGHLPKTLVAKMLDGHQQWRDAGKPGALQL